MNRIFRIILFKLLIVALTIVLFFAVLNPIIIVRVRSKDLIVKEHYIDENFSCDSILVTLTEQESLMFKEYDIKDFQIIDAVDVIELTKYTTQQLKNNKGQSNNISNYKRSLKICVKKNNKQEILDAINVLNSRDDIYAAEPNFLGEYLTVIPNDEYVDNQWAINNINLFSTWDYVTGDETINVGIVDSGIDNNHPDLVSNVDISLSSDFTGDNNPWYVSNYHGTHVAGIVGAIGNNAIGIAGVNWNVNLVSLKIGESIPTADCVVAAIDYANTHNIPILNMSFSVNNDIALSNIIDLYYGIIVCAAGNTVRNIDVNPVYPASYSSNNIISVGAIEIDNDIWFTDNSNGSNYGASSVDIFAPGYNILSTVASSTCSYSNIVFNDGTRLCEFSESNINILLSHIDTYGFSWEYIISHFEDLYGYTPTHFAESFHQSNGHHYRYLTGTSMATPFVTGVAALLLSINPSLTGAQIKTAIMNSAVLPDMSGVNPLEGLCVSNGKLDAYGAVKYVLTNYVSTPYTLNNSITTINISHTALANNDYFTNDNGFYKLNVSGSIQYDFNVSSSYPIDVLLYDGNFNQLTYIDLNNSSSIVEFRKTLSSGTYYLRVKYQTNAQAGTINTQIKHNHSYTDHYQWKSTTEHKSYCLCNGYITDFHIVSPDAYQNGNQFAICLLCGGIASFGGIIHDGIGGFPYTLNGSFILPNGVIVLEEADMEAYLNGTLIFINPNENIDRSNTFIPCVYNKK